jgi:hypothetical protein
MAGADLAIVPPDMIFHELMMLRVPTALIADSDATGQQPLGEYAGMNGFGLYLGEAGSMAADSGRMIGQFISDMEARQRMSLRVAELVDGLGRFRLADELLRLGAR